MDSLRVCHVIHDTQCGGTESMLYKLIRELHQRHDFSVVSLMGCGEVGRAIQSLGVPVHSLQLADQGKPKPHRLYRAIAQLRKEQPDVVQTWAYHADLVGGLAAKIATNAAVVWNIRHATLDPQLDSANVLRSAKLCARFSDWIPDRILLNAEAAVGVHAVAGYRREKMQVLSNGFDTQQFRPMPEEGRAVRAEFAISPLDLVIGMCGRFHPHKGQHQFVSTAKHITSQRPGVQFVMAGRGCDAENQELTGWIAQAGLTSQFHLLGSRSDIPHVLNALDVYLLPSLTEGMPNVIGEAMACGKLVVATDVGDAGRLLGDRGKLVTQDTQMMAQAVEEFLAMPDQERHAMGDRARQRIVENFELSVIANAYETVWRDTITQRAKTPAASGFQPAMRSKSPNAPASNPKLVHVTSIPMTQWLFLRGQFSFMAREGFAVHSVSSPGEYLDEIQARDPVTTHAIPISRQITPIQDATTVYRLFKLFRALQPEIVQLSTPKAALLGAIAAKAACVPIRIYQVRGLSSESESGITRWIFQRLEQLTARLCNGCLVNADSLLDYARQAKILESGLVAGQGMSNGVDLERFNPKMIQAADMNAWDPTWNEKTGPVIGFLGRLTRDKGIEDLFQAWSRLQEEYPSTRLLLVGPWESENAVAQATYDGLLRDPRVILTGTQHNVGQLYKRMDIFVYPSHGTEGFPNAPMEAAAMQLPVIATRVVGCVDAVAHGETGQIIAPRSATELEAALRRYLDQPGLRQQHGLAGRERIRTGFAPIDLWQEFREYYVHLLRRNQLSLPIPLPQQSNEEKRAA